MKNLDINSYPGSKNANGVYQWIINHIPEFSRYFEPFAGSGAIGLRLIELISQENSDDVEFYKRWFFFYDLDKNTLRQLETRKCSLEDNQLRRRAPASINKLNAFDFLSMIDTTSTRMLPGPFIYLDPPYLFETRSSNKSYYNFEMTDQDHISFLKLVNQVSRAANIMISHYDHNLYKDHLEGWHTSTFWTVNRAGNRVQEKIWMNYDIKQMNLATTKFLGKNFTERQQKKRKIYSLVRKFNQLSRHEKQAVMTKIKSK